MAGERNNPNGDEKPKFDQIVPKESVDKKSVNFQYKLKVRYDQENNPIFDIDFERLPESLSVPIQPATFINPPYDGYFDFITPLPIIDSALTSSVPARELSEKREELVNAENLYPEDAVRLLDLFSPQNENESIAERIISTLNGEHGEIFVSCLEALLTQRSNRLKGKIKTATTPEEVSAYQYYNAVCIGTGPNGVTFTNSIEAQVLAVDKASYPGGVYQVLRNGLRVNSRSGKGEGDIPLPGKTGLNYLGKRSVNPICVSDISPFRWPGGMDIYIATLANVAFAKKKKNLDVKPQYLFNTTFEDVIRTNNPLLPKYIVTLIDEFGEPFYIYTDICVCATGTDKEKLFLPENEIANKARIPSENDPVPRLFTSSAIVKILGSNNIEEKKQLISALVARGNIAIIGAADSAKNLIEDLKGMGLPDVLAGLGTGNGLLEIAISWIGEKSKDCDEFLRDLENRGRYVDVSSVLTQAFINADQEEKRANVRNVKTQNGRAVGIRPSIMKGKFEIIIEQQTTLFGIQRPFFDRIGNIGTIISAIGYESTYEYFEPIGFENLGNGNEVIDVRLPIENFNGNGLPRTVVAARKLIFEDIYFAGPAADGLQGVPPQVTREELVILLGGKDAEAIRANVIALFLQGRRAEALAKRLSLSNTKYAIPQQTPTIVLKYDDTKAAQRIAENLKSNKGNSWVENIFEKYEIPTPTTANISRQTLTNEKVKAATALTFMNISRTNKDIGLQFTITSDKFQVSFPFADDEVVKVLLEMVNESSFLQSTVYNFMKRNNITDLGITITNNALSDPQRISLVSLR